VITITLFLLAVAAASMVFAGPAQRSSTKSQTKTTICYGDLDDSGSITAADLLLLLAAWGPCPGPYVAEVPGVYLCPEDLTGPGGLVDGWVGVPDLLLILGAWDGCACFSDVQEFWTASWPFVPHTQDHTLPCTPDDIDHWSQDCAQDPK
jgi:hypothetical protein